MRFPLLLVAGTSMRSALPRTERTVLLDAPVDAALAPRGGWRIVLFFFALGALLLAAYVHVTPFDSRSHDNGSHFYQMELIRKTHRIPDGKDCWECHQPPLYYVVAVAVLSAAHLATPDEHAPSRDRGAVALQSIGAAFALGTLAFWLMTVRVFLGGAYERTVASALCTFWPTLAIQGCKIGNDAPMYFFASASLCLLVWWRVSGAPWRLVVAACAAGLAANTKGSGLVAVAVFLVAMAASVASPRPGRRRWQAEITWAALALGATMAAWTLVAFRVKHGQLHPDFRGMGDDLIVRNTPVNFLSLHLDTFARDPFVHVTGGAGRDEFWNYLLRSSLFGEFVSEDGATRTYAYALVLLTVIFVPFALAGLTACLLRALRRDDAGHVAMAATLLGSIAFLVALRLMYPFAPHNDFRFVLPAALPFAAMVGLALGRVRRLLARRWPHLAALPAGLVLLFCLASLRVLLVWP